MIHVPVLLDEVLRYLEPAPGKNFIDATLNGGGHALALAERVQPGGRILGIELDPNLLAEFRKKLEATPYKDTVITVNDSYANMEQIAKDYVLIPDGVLFDLGLSSWHFEQSGRGFSFQKDEPLDMRFDPSRGEPASTIVNLWSEEDLARIFTDYGEERFAGDISKAIVKQRKNGPIMTVPQLVDIIAHSVSEWYKHRRIHFATKTFQALRIAVNDELENIQSGVEAAIKILKPGGRIVVISFQGLEDKIVKNIFKEKAQKGVIRLIEKGTILPKWEERKRNPRARSAKMKIAEKI